MSSKQAIVRKLYKERDAGNILFSCRFAGRGLKLASSQFLSRYLYRLCDQQPPGLRLRCHLSSEKRKACILDFGPIGGGGKLQAEILNSNRRSQGESSHSRNRAERPRPLPSRPQTPPKANCVVVRLVGLSALRFNFKFPPLLFCPPDPIG